MNSIFCAALIVWLCLLSKSKWDVRREKRIIVNICSRHVSATRRRFIIHCMAHSLGDSTCSNEFNKNEIIIRYLNDSVSASHGSWRRFHAAPNAECITQKIRRSESEYLKRFFCCYDCAVVVLRCSSSNKHSPG